MKTRLVVAVAAIAVVAIGAALVSRLGTYSPGPDHDPVLSSGMPVPPDGMRWVGYGDVVFAVPETWTTDDAPCNLPQSNTVWLAIPGDYFPCGAEPVAGLSSLRISLNTISTRGGEPGPGFTVDSPDEQLATEILDSHLALPTGWTTVPWRLHGSALNMARELRRVGLDAQIVREYVPEEGANQTVPSSGSPVRLGTAITVVIPVDRPMVIRQAIAAPGHVLDVEFPEGAPNGEDYLMSLRSSPRITAPYQLSSDSADGDMHRLVIPEDAAPGLYRICVKDSVEPVCDVLTVVD
jgi:hypothetical protein